MDRRTVLKLASILGLSFSFGHLWECNASSAGKGRIDVHHHILPPVYTAALKKIGITKAGGIPFPSWNSQKSLDVMDRNGIAAAMLSISAPGVYFGDIDFTIDLARQCNEFSAGLVRDNQMRFGGFAVLPLPNVEAALRELEYALDVLKLDGIVLLTNVGGHYLGSPEFDNLYSELNRRKAVVFIHPTTPPDNNFPKMDRISSSLIEFVFDTTRAITNLILNNTLESYPDIRFIVSHAGGTAPYIAWRMSLLDYSSRENYVHSTIDNLKSLYYDTALSASPYALNSLQELADPSRILFGSDYPFVPEIIIGATVSGLKNFDGFDKEKLEALERDNALKLFPRLIA